jgi:2,4-dienoyl-CoA reductase (NADPH2)
MLIASQSPYKKDRLGKLIQYQVGELDRNGVHVRLGVEADIKLIVKGKPDVVILASGGVSIIPDIPGVEKSNVVSALDVLTGSKKVDDTVVIIGGGKIGCETADLLSESGKKITILEMLNRVGSDINRMARWPLMRRLKSREVRIETSVKVKEITDRGVRYADRDGTVEFFEANSIILAVGLRPNNELAERLQGKVVELHSIGDCVEVRQILEAIDDGFSVAKDI